MLAKDLKSGYYKFGNKGNVWSDNVHIYKIREGILCGTPALSHNWAKEWNHPTVKCPKCLAKYETETVSN